MRGARPVLFNIAAAAMPILTLPIIARLFPPAIYGSYAAFLAAATLICFLGTLRLDLAFVAERQARYAGALVALATTTILLAALMWTLVLPALVPGWSAAPRAFGVSPAIAGPFVVMLGGMVFAQAALLRSGATWALATLNLTFHLVFFATAVALSRIDAPLSGNGVLDGRVAAIVVALGIFLILGSRLGIRPRFPAPGDILPALRRHADTIRFTYPYTIVGMLSADLILFALILRGEAAMAGGYGLVRTVLLAAGSVFGAAVSPLYFRLALVADATTVAAATRRLALAVGPASFFAFGVAAGAARPLVDFAFGTNWAIAADIVLLFAYPAAWTMLTGWPERIFEARSHQASGFLLHLFWGGAAGLAIGATILSGGHAWAMMSAYAAATLVFQVAYAVRAFALAGLPMRWIAVLGLLATAAFGVGFALTAIAGRFLAAPAQIAVAFALVALAGLATARPLLTGLAAVNTGPAAGETGATAPTETHGAAS